MAEGARATKGERFGEWVGRRWHWYVCQETKALQWFKGKGVPQYFGKSLAWALRLILLLILLIILFVIAAIAAIAYVSSKCRGHSASESEEWSIGNKRRHKKHWFY
jgi:hypothetical protein